MRILILGGDGMLGHELLRSWRGRHEVFVTLRQDEAAYANFASFDADHTIHSVDVRRLQDVVSALARVKPAAVVNAIGIVKQRATAKESIPSLEVNSLFPHRLAELCLAASARVIHLSTDCVFSGAKGAYVETDAPDAKDLYGRSKLLGELHDPHCLTLRTSIIGLELSRKKSLIEWFLAQRGQIRGFKKAIYSGLTTQEMAHAIEHALVHEPDLSGVWHLSSEPITKYDLLRELSERLGRTDIEIVPDDDFRCDRSLDCSALRGRVKYRVPSWAQMLQGLVNAIQERKRTT